MKAQLKILGLLGIFSLVTVGSHANTSIPYKIKGEVISLLPEVTERDQNPTEVDNSASDAAEDETDSTIEDQAIDPVDLSNAILTITYDITNDEGESETVTLVEQHFDGTFEFEGEVHEPTEITISLKVSDEAKPREVDTVLGTGRDIHFALIDRPGPLDRFRLVGINSSVLNPKNKFSISGDLSFLGDEFEETTAYLDWTRIDDDGESKKMSAGAWLHNRSFLIEGDIGEPQIASFYVSGSNIPGFFIRFDVVLEPQGEYTVRQLGNQTDEFCVVSKSGYHAILIDSWQQHEDYTALRDKIAMENERLQELIRTGARDSTDSEIRGSDAVEEVSTSTSVQPAEGCEDAVEQPEEVTLQPVEVVPYQALRSKIAALEQDLDERRTQALIKIADSHEDPMARYLAVRFNPWDRTDYSPQISILRELENDMDADFAAYHVTPLIESMELSALVASNDSSLIAGQKVPEFSLVNFDGEEIALFDLLAEKDLVLIDFWASWCGPCIADFPELKKLYSAYTDENFEIVGVSIDSTNEDWIGGVVDYELPWVNLGEVKGWDGPVAVSYGVNEIPKAFLVDSKGCIYKKNIRPATLRDFLVDRYGTDESLVEPEEKTEDIEETSS